MTMSRALLFSLFAAAELGWSFSMFYRALFRGNEKVDLRLGAFVAFSGFGFLVMSALALAGVK